MFSLILLANGQVYAFGNNKYGKLGLNDEIHTNIPTLIYSLNNIVQIATGENHSLALTDKGQIYAFGSNMDGQLGLGYSIYFNMVIFDPSFVIGTKEDNYTNKPLLNNTLKDIIQIAAGWYFSLALTMNGQIYSCGFNGSGQLGLGDDIERNTFTLIENLNNIIQIAGGSSYSLALTNEGQVYAFGNNNWGQLGLGNLSAKYRPTPLIALNNTVQISAGGSHSLILTNTGQIFAFGENIDGQLGLGDNIDKYVPTQIYYDVVDVIKISVGSNYSLAFTANGRIYAFGNNNWGQLGLGDKINRNIPMFINKK